MNMNMKMSRIAYCHRIDSVNVDMIVFCKCDCECLLLFPLNKNQMKRNHIILSVAFITLFSCIRIEEEPILTINPTADISAHIKNQKVFATVQINVNPQILTVGNIPLYYEYEGELAIYNTRTGTIIDVNAFTGGGLSQVYTVSADTASHKRFVVIASGEINAFADIGDDADPANDKILTTSGFYSELQIIPAEILPAVNE